VLKARAGQLPARAFDRSRCAGLRLSGPWDRLWLPLRLYNTGSVRLVLNYTDILSFHQALRHTEVDADGVCIMPSTD